MSTSLFSPPFRPGCGPPVVFGAAGSVSVAWANTVTYNFGGTFGEQSNDALPGIPLGTPFTGTLTRPIPPNGNDCRFLGRIHPGLSERDGREPDRKHYRGRYLCSCVIPVIPPTL